MATFRKRKSADGQITYQVLVRKKNQKISKTFIDKETAELYAWIKEKTIDEMDAFNVPDKQLLTVFDCLEMKKQDYKNNGQETSYRHAETATSFFRGFFPKNLTVEELTPEFLKDTTEVAFQVDVKRGGNKRQDDGTGKIAKISPETLRRHFAILSSAIGYVQSIGYNVPNPMIEFMGYFRSAFLDKD